KRCGPISASRIWRWRCRRLPVANAVLVAVPTMWALWRRPAPVLKQRVITAVVLAAGLLLLLFLLPPDGLALAFGAIVLVGMWEWSNLADLRAPVYRIGYCLLGTGAMWLLHDWTALLGLVPDLVRLRDVLIVAAVWWSIGL